MSDRLPDGLHSVFLVAEREVMQGLRSRAFRISVAVTVVLVAAAALLPNLLGGDKGPPHYTVAVAGTVAPASAATPAAAGSAPADTDVIGADDLRPVLADLQRAAGVTVDVVAVAGEPEAADAVRQGDADVALVGERLLSDGTPPDRLVAVVESARTLTLQQRRVAEAALTPPQQDILGRPVPPLSVETLGQPSDGGALGVASIAIIALFMAVTFYGGAVMNGVLQEKASRVVEVVLATISPRQLLTGKLAGIGLLGLGQIGLLGIVALVVTQVFGTADLPSSTAPTIMLAVLWFLLGYALYSSLFAMAASLVSRQEDAQAAATPVSLLSTASYLVSLLVVLPNPDGALARVLTFVPLTAPMTVLGRVALDAISWWEVALSAAVTVLAVIWVVQISARVYAGAALHSGPRLRWRQAFRAGAAHGQPIGPNAM